MAQEGLSGSTTSITAGVTLKLKQLIKESLAELLQENANLIQLPQAPAQQSQVSQKKGVHSRSLINWELQAAQGWKTVGIQKQHDGKNMSRKHNGSCMAARGQVFKTTWL